MVEKSIKIKINDQEVEILEAELKKLKKQLDGLDKPAEKLDGSLKKVGENGGAISTLDSLTGGLATRIRDAYEASKLFNVSLKATKGALIATGIGAFVVALGLIITYWDEIVEFVTEANKKLEEQIRILERQAEILETELSLLDKQLELNKLQGKENEELRKKKIELLQTQLAINGAELTSLQVQRERLQNQALEITLLERIRAALPGGGVALPTISKEEQAELDETQERIDTLQKSILDAKIALQTIRNGGDDSNKEKRDSIDNVEDSLTKEFEQAEIRLKVLKQIDEEIFDSRKQLEDSALKSTEAFINSEAALNAKRALQQRETSKLIQRQQMEELEYQNEVTQAKGDLLFQFSDLLAVFGDENKELAIASIVVEQIASAAQIISATGVANAKAVAASPLTGGQPWVTINTISAGLSIATGAAAAAKAIAELGGSGGGGAESFGGQSTPPAFNVVDSSSDNQLNQALLENNNEPVEAFVVDKNVTSSQEARRNKVSASSF